MCGPARLVVPPGKGGAAKCLAPGRGAAVREGLARGPPGRDRQMRSGRDSGADPGRRRLERAPGPGARSLRGRAQRDGGPVESSRGAATPLAGPGAEDGKNSWRLKARSPVFDFPSRPRLSVSPFVGEGEARAEVEPRAGTDAAAGVPDGLRKGQGQARSGGPSGGGGGAGIGGTSDIFRKHTAVAESKFRAKEESGKEGGGGGEGLRTRYATRRGPFDPPTPPAAAGCACDGRTPATRT